MVELDWATISCLTRVAPPRSLQAPAAPVLAREQKRRKAESTGPKEPKKPRVPKPPRGTTAIFVSRLPLSTTAPLLASVFSKAGLILEDAEGELRIKMYKDEQGRFKGEALIVYLQEASVDLAVRLFDETELELGSGEGSMGVKKAEWEKKDGEDADRKPADGARSGGKTDLDKQKAGKRAEKLKQCVSSVLVPRTTWILVSLQSYSPLLNMQKIDRLVVSVRRRRDGGRGSACSQIQSASRSQGNVYSTRTRGRCHSLDRA